MRIILLVTLTLISCFITACGTTSYNPTVFNYEYQQQLIADKPIKKVVLAPINLGVPAPSYLRKGELKSRAMVKAYLKANGYEVLPNYHFENARKQASRTYGDVYDPSTGKIDAKAWRGTMITIGEKIRENTDADAIIFADIFEHNVQHGHGMKHYARWYGVTRKPALQGIGDGVPLDFNWGQQIKAASVMITVYNTDLVPVFTSRGGIDTLEAIDLKHSTPSFVRSKKILKNKNHIQEGIELAFHPFIEMKKYPGKTEDNQAEVVE